MTINRALVRKQLASILETKLASYVDEVYPYQVGDIQGSSPVVVVTNSGTERRGMEIGDDSYMHLDVHTFVLYSLPPVLATNVTLAGTSVILETPDTSMFSLTQEIVVDREKATILDIDDDVSITVDELLEMHENAQLYIWTEEQSEDMIDDLEYLITEGIKEANDADLWTEIEREGESEIDVVDVGGSAYRHELMSVKATVQDF